MYVKGYTTFPSLQLHQDLVGRKYYVTENRYADDHGFTKLGSSFSRLVGLCISVLMVPDGPDGLHCNGGLRGIFRDDFRRG